MVSRQRIGGWRRQLDSGRLQKNSEFQKRRDRRRLESLSTFEEFQLDEKLRFKQLSARLANQDGGGSRCSTSRKQVIY